MIGYQTRVSTSHWVHADIANALGREDIRYSGTATPPAIPTKTSAGRADSAVRIGDHRRDLFGLAQGVVIGGVGGLAW